MKTNFLLTTIRTSIYLALLFLQLTLELFQVRQFLRNDALFPRLQRRFCDINVQSAGLCRNVLLASVGDDSNQMPSVKINIINAHSIFIYLF